MYLPVDWPLPDLAALRAASVPDRTALVDAETGRSWSYRELSDGPVARLAAGIRAAGVAPGDELGVLVPPGVRMAQLVHAAARAGAVFVPLAPDAPPAALEERCAVAGVKAVVCRSATVPQVEEWFDGPVFAVDGSRTGDEPALQGSSAEGSPAHAWRPDEAHWLVFTSGTLGDAKAVVLTARNLVASATASAFRLGVSPDDRWLACLPMHHVGGMAPLVRSALYGTAVVVQSGFDAGETAAVMATHDVTAVSLVPTMLTRLLDGGWSPPSTLRFVLLGGAPASVELIGRCAEAGVPVCPTYGATETASQVATARPREAVTHPGTVGRPLRGIEVQVSHGDSRSGASDGPGELVVAGPVVAAGYHGDDGSTARRFDDGVFRTRDRGILDAEGRVWVLGRLDDAILTGGETVHPADVEAAIRSHPAVDDVAVVGLADEEWGEVVAALVVGGRSAAVDASTLADHCRARLEPHEVPAIVLVTDELPRTDSGTVDRAAARERIRAARGPDDL